MGRRQPAPLRHDRQRSRLCRSRSASRSDVTRRSCRCSLHPRSPIRPQPRPNTLATQPPRSPHPPRSIRPQSRPRTVPTQPPKWGPLPQSILGVLRTVAPRGISRTWGMTVKTILWKGALLPARQRVICTRALSTLLSASAATVTADRGPQRSARLVAVATHPKSAGALSATASTEQAWCSEMAEIAEIAALTSAYVPRAR
jgi:hypothetical protein